MGVEEIAMDILKIVSGLASQTRYKEVRSGLRPVGWFEVPGSFRFGYPWPWEQFQGDLGPVGGDGESLFDDLIGALRAPRSKGTATVAVWSARGTLRALEPSADKRFARLYGGVHRGLRRLRAGGAPVLVIDIAMPGGEQVSRGLVGAAADQVVHVELRVPGVAATGYRPHFDAMLASWTWA
jgi:hypothetical protein